MYWLEQHWYRTTWLHLLLRPVSFVFSLLAAMRRIFYRYGLLSAENLSVPVIVVGNITVGGSGKTPLSLWLAQQLIHAGWHPGIISRGYGSKSDHIQAVNPFCSPDEAGDEAVLMAERKLCPVWIGRDRPAVARALLRAHPDCNILISDDGLQHYRLNRTIEIAVIDGTRRFGNGCQLPAGPLREPLSRLKQVDAVVVNGGEIAEGEFYMELVGNIFHNLLNPLLTRHAMDFTGMRLHAIAGIGHPQRFFDQLKNMGLSVQSHAFPDHYSYKNSDLNYSDADAILMTEKDAVKCLSFANENYWVLRVDAHLSPTFAHHILQRIACYGYQVA